ncbi:sensor histidine kinase NtrY-like [Indioceanicola profundi]|uniref:sensor histidine kinase NtrY-like n=1 Tax=Indioceanicola profundi TaxID=2220096 RepID=UPI000E6ACA70|nr:PAS domain-containing sensor histidine kinase [Indioceanicola profundi]
MSDTQAGAGPSPWWRRVSAWSGRYNLGNRLAVVLALAAIASGMATYTAMMDLPPFGNDPNTVSLLLTLNLVLLLLLGVVTARRIVMLWLERRRGLAGAKLHARLVAIFSLLTALPAIIMATFAAIFFYVGVQSWFSERVSTAVNEALAVAEAYLKEHQRTIEADLLAAAADLQRQGGQFILLEPERLRQLLFLLAIDRNFTEIVVFDGRGQEMARHGLLFSFRPDQVPTSDLDRARAGNVVVGDEGDRVTALVRLDPEFDTFMYVGRPVEAQVLASMESTQSAVNEYRELEGKRFDLQTRLTLIFLVVAMLLLMGAIWAGLNFATYLVLPIGALIGAAERVSDGDLTARVPEAAGDQDDELSTLSKVFNRMTGQLESQRGELMEVNRQLDLRRRFTEAVLAGVSAGVVGLDQDGRVNLPNLSAVELLNVGGPEELIGRPLEEVAPEMQELMDSIRRRPGKLVEGQVQIRRGSHVRTLLVRVAAEVVGGDIRGFVVTFDDVSELLLAQRKAAWADVARRIAHEIKNPLTPIQLSAERLRRKYLKEISSDPETFKAMTDTIVRHVDDIGRMVDEFSAFARMPQPVMKPVAIQELCRQAVFLQATAHGSIRFEQDLPATPLVTVCDSRQVGQALTNLLKNAIEAIEGRDEAGGGSQPPGFVAVRVRAVDDHVVISVEDNGKGLPVDERDRLVEPYVTTRAKGTGLGLAIVKKIMEDHGGALTLEDRSGGGARVSLVLPRTLTATVTEPGQSAPQPETVVAGRKG